MHEHVGNELPGKKPEAPPTLGAYGPKGAEGTESLTDRAHLKEKYGYIGKDYNFDCRGHELEAARPEWLVVHSVFIVLADPYASQCLAEALERVYGQLVRE
jgi:hypothetical protein